MSAVSMTALFDYEAQPKELISHCNLCGDNGAVVEWEGGDRYGYKVTVESCLDCELTVLNPRMTKEAYAKFYNGPYRALVSAFHGREINAQTIQQEQIIYGRALARQLLPYRADYRWRLLDIGGSTGVVATQLSEALEMKATVLDPSTAELEHARGHHAVLQGSIETLETELVWDIVTLCQTADHLLDLMGSLRKIKSLLSPEGLFWSDIVDFEKTREVKIDHPFNLTESTYRRFLSTAGFQLLQVNYSQDGIHIGFLCK